MIPVQLLLPFNRSRVLNVAVQHKTKVGTRINFQHLHRSQHRKHRNINVTHIKIHRLVHKTIVLTLRPLCRKQKLRLKPKSLRKHRLTKKTRMETHPRIFIIQLIPVDVQITQGKPTINAALSSIHCFTFFIAQSFKFNFTCVDRRNKTVPKSRRAPARLATKPSPSTSYQHATSLLSLSNPNKNCGAGSTIPPALPQ